MAAVKLIAVVLIKRLAEIGMFDELSAVCRAHHALLEEVLSGSRSPQVVKARRAICVLLKEQHMFSYPEIGRTLGIDHSSAVYAVKKHREQSGG